MVLAGYPRSPDLLEVAGLPTLVEGRFSQALEPEDLRYNRIWKPVLMWVKHAVGMRRVAVRCACRLH